MELLGLIIYRVFSFTFFGVLTLFFGTVIINDTAELLRDFIHGIRKDKEESL